MAIREYGVMSNQAPFQTPHPGKYLSLLANRVSSAGAFRADVLSSNATRQNVQLRILSSVVEQRVRLEFTYSKSAPVTRARTVPLGTRDLQGRGDLPAVCVDSRRIDPPSLGVTQALSSELESCRSEDVPLEATWPRSV